MRKNANQGDVKFYTLIAIVLGVITFFEFAFVEWQGLLFNQDGLILWSLYILSIVKFFLVVMFFMHLWGDHNLLSQLFTAGMVVGSITVALMLMLFTANNMNRYRVEQPVSVVDAHGGGHGGGHGDEGHVEIPVRDFAETLSRPAPKSQQYALAPRESIDAGSLNLPTLSLPTINQGVQPLGSSEIQPIVEESMVVEATVAEPMVVEPMVVEAAVTETTTSVTTQPVVETTQVVETVTTAMVTEPVVTTATTTETVTTEVATVDTAVDTSDSDLAALRAQVEALRLELESMESDVATDATNSVAATTTTIQATTAPVTTAPVVVETPQATAQTTVTETVTTTVTQAAPVAAAATVTAAATTAVATAASSSTNATSSNTSTETVSASAVTTETVDVSFDTELGNATYMNCLACHQMTGEGIPGAFPPLKGHMPDLYNAEGGREYLIQVVLYGLQGEISAGGMTYNGMMTPWNSLSDDAIASVLNHELTSWGNDALLNDFSPIMAEEVAAQRATPLTPQEVLANRVIQ